MPQSICYEDNDPALSEVIITLLITSYQLYFNFSNWILRLETISLLDEFVL